MIEETISIKDDSGFIHEATFIHSPHLGFSTAYTIFENIICQVERGKLNEPHTDSDQEWERFEELLQEWIDSVNGDLKAGCLTYFNNQRS